MKVVVKAPGTREETAYRKQGEVERDKGREEENAHAGTGDSPRSVYRGPPERQSPSPLLLLPPPAGGEEVTWVLEGVSQREERSRRESSDKSEK